MKTGPVSWLAPAVAWTAYLPLGAKYTVALAALPFAIRALRQQAPRAEIPGLAPAATLLALLVLSATWSMASAAEIGAHLWLYGLVLWVPMLALTMPAASARLALAHFVVASGAVAALFVLHALDTLPASWLWSSTVDATGNQRICNSLLLALGVAFALWHARHEAGSRKRLAWFAAAALIAVGLALQDRRSGLLVLPMALLAWALLETRAPGRRVAAVLLVLGGAAVTGWVVEPVRERFAEGLRELAAAEPADRVHTSWGQRLHMLQITAGMVQERPLTGHGVASWRLLWQQRTPAGSALAEHTTPHNEYLLVAQQAGWPGLLVLLWLLSSMVRAAARHGPAGTPALMVWVTLATAGLFNAVLRDAKFSLVLLLLAAVATAATSPARRGDG